MHGDDKKPDEAKLKEFWALLQGRIPADNTPPPPSAPSGNGKSRLSCDWLPGLGSNTLIHPDSADGNPPQPPPPSQPPSGATNSQ